MREFKSGFAPMIQEYLTFRERMGFGENHAKNLFYFDCFCAQQYSGETKLTAHIVREWISYEVKQGHRGLENKSSAIRLFAKYLGKGAYILPTGYVKQKSSFAPYIFTDGELAALFHAADTLKHRDDRFVPVVIPVMLRLSYACGLRPNECRCLLRENISFDTGEILITKTKRNKERIIVMSDDMLEIMCKYDVRRTSVARDDDHFFIRENGKMMPPEQYRNMFFKCWRMANEGLDEAKIPRARLYDLRHRYASTLLQKWIDEGRNLYAMLPFLRAYMGHERMEDTAYYIHVLPERLLLSPGVDWERLDSTIPGVDVWER